MRKDCREHTSVQMTVEVDHGDGSIGAVNRPQQRQGNGVVAA